MKKNWWKIALDVVMLAVIALFYSKTAINLQYHEIAGLAVFALFLLHLIFNWKWIANITKRLFDKAVPFKTKLCYIIDALLLIGFIVIIVSGALISKIVFSFGINAPWAKPAHYFTAALVIILLGIHIGLHVKFVGSMLAKLTHLKPLLSQIVGVALAAVIALYGIYVIPQTSFVNWLSMPFSASQAGGEHMGESAMGNQTGPRDGSGKGAQRNANGEAQSGEHLRSEGQNGNMNGAENGFGNAGGEAHGENSRQGGFVKVLETIAKYGSMVCAFAFITGIIDWIIRKMRSKKEVKA